MGSTGISWFTAFWLAVVLIVAMALVIAALLRRENYFGDFAREVVRIVSDTHDDNKMVQQKNALIQVDNLRILEQLEECRKRLQQSSNTERSA